MNALKTKDHLILTKYRRPQDLIRRETWSKRLGWRLEALGWDLIAGLSKLMPVDKASDLGAWIASSLGQKMSVAKTARRNLRLAFPDKSEDEIDALSKASFQSLGRTGAEMFHLNKIDPYKSDRVKVMGVERLDAVKEASKAGQKGAVFFSGHFANWEVMAAVVCNRVDCDVTYRAANNPYIDKRINAIRHGYGIGVLTPKGIGAKELMSALRKGRAIALMNDQKFNQGMELPFLGHPAMTAPGASRLALKYDVPLIPVTTKRTAPARFEVTIHEAITFPDKTLGEEERLTETVKRVSTFLEEEIRKNPEQWFWQHRRWPKEAWINAGVMD